MSDPDDRDVPLVFALALAAELEARGISYAIGGALALGVWGYARGTIDVQAAANPDLDHSYIRNALVEMVGDDDPRVAFWDEQIRRFAAP